MARGAYHHGNLREALVVAARELLEEEGIPGLSLRSVARRAGVSQSAIYHHFSGKEALVVELCHSFFHDLSDRTRTALGGCTGIAQCLRAMAHAYHGFSEEHPEAFGIMFGGQGMIENKDDHQGLSDMAGGSLEQLLEVIGRGIEQGEIAGCRPIDAALSAWSAVHGAVALLRDYRFDSPKMQALGADPDRLLDTVVDLFVAGLRPQCDCGS